MKNPNPTNPVLKGTIVITDDLNLVYSVPDNRIKILSLDEDKMIDPKAPNVIQATNLLPPIEALIAESDGDEDLYNLAYFRHLNEPYNQQFIGAIIAYLYKGGSFLVFAPQLKDSIAILKLREQLWMLYGVGMGIEQSVPFELDYRCIPIWLTTVYCNSVISPYQFLMEYPVNAAISEPSMRKLIGELSPYASSYNDKKNVIKELHQTFHKKGKPAVLLLHDIRGSE